MRLAPLCFKAAWSARFRRKEPAMTSGAAIAGHYDTWIVTLSVLIGVMGGYCTIELAERVTASRHLARLYWWIGGSTAMAIGTWSMHYTGMLALRLPIPVLYDWPTSFLSYLASLFASLIALFVVSRRQMGFTRASVGSIFMGGGIVALHYIAMASMRLKAMHHYSPPLVSLSVMIAVAFSLLSLWFMFWFRDDGIGRKWRKFGSALLLGAAISVMHYIGMAAMTFMRSDVLPDFSRAVPIDDLGIIGIGAANVMVFVVVILTSLADRLQNQTTMIRIFSRRLEEVRESERRHLARELHDEIGQALTAAKINTVMLRSAIPSELAPRLNENAAILDRLLQQTRQISLDLRPPLLDDLGLVPALRWYVNQQTERAGLEAKISADPLADDVPPHIRLACFRLAQEAITNVVRHAQAKIVKLELRRTESCLRLRVRDDGKGFDVAAAEARAEQGASLGLLSLKERAALAGGGAHITSSPGEGTTVEVFLPLTPGGECASHDPAP
jgi:signal transduction histidine kinase